MIDPSQIEIRVDPELSGADAFWRGRRVGYLVSMEFDKETRLLSDVLVIDRIELGHGLLARLIRRAVPGYGVLDVRRAGIGTMLVKKFLDACETARVEEVFGNVTTEGLAECPFLLEWYERLGFRLAPPDGRAEFFTMASKVIWRPTQGN